MSKRKREEPCLRCGHYHNHEEGEPCDICGHLVAFKKATPVQAISSPSEILPGFLFLGTYSDVCDDSDHLRSLGISCILNTVPLCENMYPNSFTYHRLEDKNVLEFENAIHFLEKCEEKNSSILVQCMSGRNRSPAIVIAYLMKRNGWRLDQSYLWVKQRRPSIDITPEFQQQLREFEEKLFRSRAVYGSTEPTIQLQGSACRSLDDDNRMDTS